MKYLSLWFLYLILLHIGAYLVTCEDSVQRINKNPPLEPNAGVQNPVAGAKSNVANLQGNNLKIQEKLQKVKTFMKNPLGLISGSEECGDDVIRICGSRKYNPNNNFDILACLVNNQDDISNACNRFLWHFKVNVTENVKYGQVAQKLCKQALIESPDCDSDKPDGRVISCLSERRDTIKEPACLSFLTKFQSIIFSDYHLICDFIEQCKTDILKYKCGSVSEAPEEEENSHSQGRVVGCLEKELVKDASALQPLCFKQIIRIAELSADDYHLDRALYFKCKNDRENLCGDVVAGQGKVYQCLFNHKFDSQMSTECRAALTERQKVQAIDYRANSALLRECKKDIVLHKCVPGKTEIEQPDQLVHLSKILLCLEKNKTPKAPLSENCEHELIEFRRMMMESYELSPEITLHCSADVNKLCEGGHMDQGKTLHCLMNHARTQDGPLSEGCQNALVELLEETEALDDYRMDPVLASSCKSVINSKCAADSTDDSMVMACLMDHLHDRDMKKKCKSAILDLQYFVSRDFLLDPAFRKACQAEAKQNCDAFTGLDGNPVEFRFVLACLYLRIHPDPNRPPLSAECASEVHRVVRQRALDVHLNPDLERDCRHDLALLCSNGEYHLENKEFACLQELYENITVAACKKQVQQLTELESENILDFDDILAKECEPMLKEFCQSEADAGDEGAVVECLITNKEKMSSQKCAAGVTHFQLIEMKDYNFNYKFTKACKLDIEKNCKNKKNKAEVVECLSKAVRDRILGEGEKGVESVPEVSQKCRDQLTVEKLQMHTNIELNPNLHKSCRKDVERLCAHVKPGSAMVISCLRKKKKEIKNHECFKHLFSFEKEEAENPNLDFMLMRRCKSDIQTHCPGFLRLGDAQKILECLLENKIRLMEICRDVVREREKEMFRDIELNVDLQKSCKKDIEKFCQDDMNKALKAHQQGDDPEGIVYTCLISVFTDDTGNNILSDNCYSHVEFVVREEQQDFELNPSLMVACVDDIQSQCPPDTENNVIRCLEEKFLAAQIKHMECKMEIAKLLKEGRSDIQADPMLNEVCALDVNRFCHNVPEGHGKVIQCLINTQSSLSKECAQLLSERQDMWREARKLPSGFSDIRDAILESEHSAYLMSMLAFLLLLILATGVLCGRVSKRISADRKRQ